MRFSHVTAAILCAFAALPWPARAEQARSAPDASVKITPVIKADRNIADQPIVFPQKDGAVTVAIYEFPPGAELPVHKHPYPRIGYVLAGTLEIDNDQTGKKDTLKTGDVLLEAVDQWHHGRNVGSAPVRMLVVDLTPKGAQNNIPKK